MKHIDIDLFRNDIEIQAGHKISVRQFIMESHFSIHILLSTTLVRT